RGVPNSEIAMPRYMAEVAVGRQHRQFIADAELRQQRIDRPDLDSCATAPVAQLGSRDVVVPLRNKERQCRKTIQYATAGPRPGKALQQFLQYDAGGKQHLAGFD